MSSRAYRRSHLNHLLAGAQPGQGHHPNTLRTLFGLVTGSALLTLGLVWFAGHMVVAQIDDSVARRLASGEFFDAGDSAIHLVQLSHGDTGHPVPTIKPRDERSSK